VSEDLILDPETTALVLIDLQRGIAARNTMPYAAKDVITNCARLTERFRALGSPVMLVRVSFSPDGRDQLTPPVDQVTWSAEPRPAGWDEIVPEIGPRAGDHVITKRQWGAFYGTDLDLQLRRRGVNTIVIGGIATNFGVESTARDAFERHYSLVFVEDGMSSLSEGAHEFAVTTIFPRIGRVRKTEDVLESLKR
jgi:nicotinamidase-related amidase